MTVGHLTHLDLQEIEDGKIGLSRRLCDTLPKFERWTFGKIGLSRNLCDDIPNFVWVFSLLLEGGRLVNRS